MTTDRIIALDPSSTLTGYALLSPGCQLVDCGVLRPPSRYAALERIRSMAADLRHLVRETRPAIAVIEMSSGKVGARHLGGGAGLAVYGQACGALWQLLRDTMHDDAVRPVLESEWISARSKQERQLLVSGMFPSYDPDQDPGFDVADAISLGVWWLEREALRCDA